MENTYHTNVNQKKANVAIFISNNIDLGSKTVTKEKVNT